MEYNFTTINIRGLNNKIKAEQKLKRLLERFSDIVLIQETKIKCNLMFDWKPLSLHYIILEQRAKGSFLGMAICFKKSVFYNYKFVNENISNRVQKVEIIDNVNKFKMDIFNVHAPIIYKNRVKFYKMLGEHVDLNKIVCIAGDYNINDKSKQKVFKKFITGIHCIDVLELISQHKVPTRRDCRSNNVLDRIIISENVGNVSKLEYNHMPFSDHLMVTMYMNGINKKTLKCFKAKILNGDRFKEDIYRNEVINKIKILINKYGSWKNIGKWMWLKEELYKYLVQEEKNQNKMLDKQIGELKILMERMIADKEENNFIYMDTKNKLEKCLMIQKQNIINKLRFEDHVKANTNKDALIAKLKGRRKKNNINILIYKNEIIKDKQIIADKYLEFLTSLADKGRNNFDLFNNYLKEASYKFFKRKRPKLINTEDLEILNKEINLQEIRSVIKVLKEGTTPGVDGIITSIYKLFSGQMENCLLEALNNIMKMNKNSIVFKEWNKTLIIPIGKIKDNDLNYMEDIRPIALMNVDCKILNKILLNRLKPILSCLLSHHICSFKGRDISQALWETFAAFHLTERKRNINKNYILLRIDLNKAYSMTNIYYLKFLLYKYIGKSLTTKTIIHLLEKKNIAIKMEGSHQEYIEVYNGLLQGSPLSADLFVFYLNELIYKVENNIKGIKIKDIKDNLKMSVYIDDITFYINGNKELNKVLFFLREFEKMTGSRINYLKSYALNLGNGKIINHNKLQGKHGKILGIYFNTFEEAEENRHINKLLDDLKKIIDQWANTYSSYFRKANVVNKLIISKINYFIPFYYIPLRWIIRLRALIQKFIFGGLKYLSAEKTTYPVSKGGLGLLDVKALIYASKTRAYMNLTNGKFDIRLDENAINNHKNKVIKQMKKGHEELKEIDISGKKLSHSMVKTFYLNKDQSYKNFTKKKVNFKTMFKLRLHYSVENFIFKWRLKLLPTRMMLQSRGILREDNTVCPLCNTHDETQEHLLNQCLITQGFVRNKLSFVNGKNMVCKEKLRDKDVFSNKIMLQWTKWTICIYFAVWKHRCNRIFQDNNKDLEEIFGELIFKHYTLDFCAFSTIWVRRHWNIKALKSIPKLKDYIERSI